MKVYDVILFHNELDLLDLRLHELHEVVDVFVLVEATSTFSGLPKTLNFPVHKARFEKFLPKIVYFAISYPLYLDSSWSKEHYQRNFPHEYLRYVCEKEDWILLCDLDEIPNPQVIEKLRNLQVDLRVDLQVFSMDFYYYNLKWLCKDPWEYACAFRASLLPRVILQEIRLKKSSLSKVLLPSAGWHLSYFGSSSEIAHKIRSFSHTNLNTPYFTDEERIQKVLENGKDLFDRSEIGFRPRTTEPLPRYYKILPKELHPFPSEEKE